MRKLFKSLTHSQNYGIIPITLRPHHPKQLPRVFFDISINQQMFGRIVFQLFENLVPRTTQNFLKFSEGFKDQNGQPQGYKDSEFFTILPMRGIWGGDVAKGKSVSLYGGKFSDEAFIGSHNSKGMLTTANIGGPNGNDSRFIITLANAQWLDHKSILFGEVVYGFDVLDKLERLGTASGIPEVKIVVSDCGKVSQKDYEKYNVEEHFDIWETNSHH